MGVSVIGSTGGFGLSSSGSNPESPALDSVPGNWYAVVLPEGDTMPQVYVSPMGHYGSTYFYVVMVDGKQYDEFSSEGWITHSQMIDVARGYQEYFRSIDE